MRKALALGEAEALAWNERQLSRQRIALWAVRKPITHKKFSLAGEV
ncbi:hypothetical protein H6F96_25330 [Microcoleus sp. FACHB-53]|nr:hypothetical protein [Microcoleus sp. FACHB-53]